MSNRRICAQESYPSYGPAEPSRELRLTLKADHPKELTWLARGYFDGDGQEDIALPLESERSGKVRRIVLAFLRRGDLYPPIYAGQGHDVILSIKKGAVGFDFNADCKLHYYSDTNRVDSLLRAASKWGWESSEAESRGPACETSPPRWALPSRAPRGKGPTPSLSD